MEPPELELSTESFSVADADMNDIYQKNCKSKFMKRYMVNYGSKIKQKYRMYMTFQIYI